MRIERYLTHAVVLAIAIVMSGYAASDRAFHAALSARVGPVNAEAVVVEGGGQNGDVSFGRYNTIIKPLSIPTSAPISHEPFTYTVGPGETVYEEPRRW